MHCRQSQGASLILVASEKQPHEGSQPNQNCITVSKVTEGLKKDETRWIQSMDFIE